MIFRRIRNLFSSIGETKSPGVVNEEHVRLLLHRFGGEQEPPLASVVAWVNLEEIAAVECFRVELLEELAVQRRGQPCGLEEQSMNFHEILEVLDSICGHCGLGEPRTKRRRGGGPYESFE